jgi:hypothetical protein
MVGAVEICPSLDKLFASSLLGLHAALNSVCDRDLWRTARQLGATSNSAHHHWKPRSDETQAVLREKALP